MSTESPPTKSPVISETIYTDAVVVIATLPTDISTFDQVWLLKNGVLSEGDTVQNSSFSATFITVHTADFQLLILPDRLQVTIMPRDPETASGIIERIVRGYSVALPPEAFRAVGFNFGAFLPNHGGENYLNWNRNNFCPPKLAASLFVAEHNPTFGCAFMFQALGFKVQVNGTAGEYSPAPNVPAPPNIPISPGTRTMFVAINFQLEVAGPEAVLNCVSDWSKGQGLAKQIAESMS